MIYAEQVKTKQHFLPQQLRSNQRCHGAPRCEFQLRGFRGRVHGSRMDLLCISLHFDAFCTLWALRSRQDVEVVMSFNKMGLKEVVLCKGVQSPSTVPEDDVLRGVYAYGFERLFAS